MILEFLDIETTGTSNTRLLQHLQGRVDAPSNLKDPAKIRAAIEGKRKEVWSNTALNGMAGEIVCICACSEDGETEEFSLRQGTEQDILRGYFGRLERRYNENNQRLITFAGFNLASFDLRFIWQRCIVLRVPTPKFLGLWPHDEKPWSSRVIDLRHRLSGSDRFAPGSLLDWSIALGLDVPDDDIPGSEVPAAIAAGRIDEVVEHCRRDVERCRQIWQRINFHG